MSDERADLAEAVLGMAARLMDGGWADRFAGVYHAAGTGATTWHQLATATFEAAARHGAAIPTVVPVATAEWPTRAKRPPDSRLDCGRLAALFGLRLPPWRDGLAQTVAAIFATGPT
jgi:dTDP-4-dehydrorhamnose reductase